MIELGAMHRMALTLLMNIKNAVVGENAIAIQAHVYVMKGRKASLVIN
jgi:hypothetical protein